MTTRLGKLMCQWEVLNLSLSGENGTLKFKDCSVERKWPIILVTGEAKIRRIAVLARPPSQQKKLGMVAHTCCPSYCGKHK
jgi:hypothetical protein